MVSSGILISISLHYPKAINLNRKSRMSQTVTTCCFFFVKISHSFCYKWCFTWWTTLHYTWQPNPLWTLWSFVVRRNRGPDTNPSSKATSFSLWKTNKLRCKYITVHGYIFWTHTETHLHNLNVQASPHNPNLFTQTNKTRDLWVIQVNYVYLVVVLLQCNELPWWCSLICRPHLYGIYPYWLWPPVY